jgi:hypothetical protein
LGDLNRIPARRTTHSTLAAKFLKIIADIKCLKL